MSTASVHPPRFDTVTPDLDGSVTAYSHFTPSESVLRRLVEELFGNNWAGITVGPCIEGAVFEIQFTQAPEIRIADGYLTVDLGSWHFHLCIGPHQGSSSEELRKMRPVNKIAFFERRGRGCGGGRSWGIRMWNGYGEQMTTVWLPNPNLTEKMQYVKTPDWNRLSLYYRLREQFLSEALPESYEAVASLPLPEAQA